MTYFDELKKSMEYLGSKKDTLFIGQAVEVPGTAMFNTIKGIAKKKRIELPVAEDMQMGMTLGLAMSNNIPISIYPRWNFLLYGVSQLVNHIDKDLPFYLNIVFYQYNRWYRFFYRIQHYFQYVQNAPSDLTPRLQTQ